MPPVSSSAIAYIDYLPKVVNEAKRFVTGKFNLFTALTQGDLEITFHRRGTYIYYDVPRLEFINFMSAGSKGGYFNKTFQVNGKDKYSYARIG